MCLGWSLTSANINDDGRDVAEVARRRVQLGKENEDIFLLCLYRIVTAGWASFVRGLGWRRGLLLGCGGLPGKLPPSLFSIFFSFFLNFHFNPI
jgi:hypothetical protein